MAIRVDDVVISSAEIHREMQYHPAATRGDAEREAARALVVRQLLLQEARREMLDERTGLAAPPRGEEELIARLLEQKVVVEEPDPDACRAHYDLHRRALRSPDLFEASHILFLAPPGDEALRARARKSAEETIALLAEDSGRFAELARQRSDCSSASNGGSLGQLRPGDTVDEFEEALAALSPGEIRPEPLETRFGLHVLRLDEFAAGRPLPFESVAERVRDHLCEQLWRRRLQAFLLELASRSEVVGFDLAQGRFVEES